MDSQSTLHLARQRAPLAADDLHLRDSILAAMLGVGTPSRASASRWPARQSACKSPAFCLRTRHRDLCASTPAATSERLSPAASRTAALGAWKCCAGRRPRRRAARPPPRSLRRTHPRVRDRGM